MLLSDHLLRWGSKFGAIFDKTKAVFIWITRREHPSDTFMFGNQTLNTSLEVKWLGAIIDCKLMYMPMFAHLERRATGTIRQLRQLGNLRWGLKEKGQVRLMEVVLLPRVLYGALL
jgi:hypothetical protein